LSQDLNSILRQRARIRGLGWPLGLAVSLVFHLLLVAAVLFSPRAAAPPEATKVTWITLPAAAVTGPLGGAGPVEQGVEKERQRRVEEVAPRREAPAARPQAPAPVTPNSFGTRASRPLTGTNPNPASLGKAPVAAKGPAPAANPAVGAAGSGAGGGIGLGSSVPGLKASAGIDGGTGLISDLDSAFPFTYYLRQVQSLITGNWSRSSAAQGRVQVYFRIKRDGSVDGFRVESPSGSSALDQSAQFAVRRSDPLPRLPEGFEGSSLGVHFWFTFLGN
jgi:TonB family protein